MFKIKVILLKQTKMEQTPIIQQIIVLLMELRIKQVHKIRQCLSILVFQMLPIQVFLTQHRINQVKMFRIKQTTHWILHRTKRRFKAVQILQAMLVLMWLNRSKHYQIHRAIIVRLIKHKANKGFQFQMVPILVYRIQHRQINKQLEGIKVQQIQVSIVIII
jgi:hypothetical protein